MPVPHHVGAAISRGDIPTWVAAIGTLGAFIAAFIQIGTERRLRLTMDLPHHGLAADSRPGIRARRKTERRRAEPGLFLPTARTGRRWLPAQGVPGICQERERRTWRGLMAVKRRWPSVAIPVSPVTPGNRATGCRFPLVKPHRTRNGTSKPDTEL